MQNWKNLSLVDEDLVKFLQEKFPPLEFELGKTKEDFVNQAIYRAGQRDTIECIAHIIDLQRKKKKS